MIRTIALMLSVLFAGHGTAFSAEAHLRTITEQCGIQLKLSGAACACIAEAAGKQLNENEQAFMAAQVTKNQAEFARLQSQMTVGEMTKVGQFMTSIVGQCQGG